MAIAQADMDARQHIVAVAINEIEPMFNRCVKGAAQIVRVDVSVRSRIAAAAPSPPSNSVFRRFD